MRFSSAFFLALVACAKPAASPDGIVVGTAHPLAYHVAPKIGGVDLEGHPLPADAVGEHVAVVLFWASWSPHARESLESFARLHDRFGGEGVSFVSVSIDDDAAAPDEIALVIGARFTLAWDPSRELARRWTVAHVPSTFILDRVGIVRAVFTHDDPARDEADIERDLEVLLGRPVPAGGKFREPSEGPHATR
jgi:peroxiredoxin